MAKIKVKAWAVHDKNGGFIFAANTKEAAELEVRESERYHLYNRNVIPCEVSYTITKPKKKR